MNPSNFSKAAWLALKYQVCFLIAMFLKSSGSKSASLKNNEVDIKSHLYYSQLGSWGHVGYLNINFARLQQHSLIWPPGISWLRYNLRVMVQSWSICSSSPAGLGLDWDLWNGKCRVPGQDVESLLDRAAPHTDAEFVQKRGRGRVFCHLETSQSSVTVSADPGYFLRVRVKLKPGKSVSATFTQLSHRSCSHIQCYPDQRVSVLFLIIS